MFGAILNKDLEALTNKDFDILINSFAYLRDNANYEFYKYLKKHGIKGSKKPTRHEDGDLTAKLAIAMNIKRLKSVDDQQTNKEYHDSWRQCVIEGQKNGDNMTNRELNKKDYNSAVLPAVFRHLGKHTNKRKSLERKHLINSFSYVKNSSESCDNATKYWDERNHRIAKNLGTQITNGSKTRNVVIIGAGHIIGLEKELKANYPHLKIKMLYSN
jgi:hypothetical protein